MNEVRNNEGSSEAAKLDVRWLGQVEYRAAWAMQEELAAQRLRGEIGDTLLLLEHPLTLTLGRKARPEHLLASRADLERQNVALVDVDRGGDITYHGPGQLVGYPILNLRDVPHTPDLHVYLRGLEESLIRALAAFRIKADRFEGYTGVWTGRDTSAPLKIAAMGIKSSRWIVSHGFALNVCPDLTHYDWIVPCGIREYGVTSVCSLLERPVSVADVVPAVVTAFHDTFGYTNASEITTFSAFPAPV